VKVAIRTREMLVNVAKLVGRNDAVLFLMRRDGKLYVMERRLEDGEELPLGVVPEGSRLFREQKLPAVIDYEVSTNISGPLNRLNLTILVELQRRQQRPPSGPLV